MSEQTTNTETESVLGAAAAAGEGGASTGGEKTASSEGTATTEAKAEVGKAAEGKTEGDDKQATEGDKTTEAPAELKLPEGAELEPELLEAVKAKDPQKVVDALAATQQKRAEAYAKQQQEWVQEVRKEWGDKADYNLNLANRALQKFGSENLVGLLKNTGLANHPEMVRLFHRIAEADAEDSVSGTVQGQKSKPSNADRLRNLYPNSPDLKF